MSASDDFDENASRRAYGGAYTSKHPVPTIQGYREHRAELKQNLEETEDAQNEQDEQGGSRAKRAYDSVKSIVKNEDKPESSYDPYPTGNRNYADRPKREDTKTQGLYADQQDTAKDSKSEKDNQDGQGKSATEQAAGHADPKQKRKDMKNIKRTGGGREVTDPVTHLPVTIHDKTDKDLSSAPENEPKYGSQHRTATGLSGASKTREELAQEQEEMDGGQVGMEKLFPPPDYDDTRQEMARIYRIALTAGLGSIVTMCVLGLIAVFFLQPTSYIKSAKAWNSQTSESQKLSRPWLSTSIIVILIAAAGFGLTVSISGWLDAKVRDIFDDEIWDASRQQEVQEHNSSKELPESVAWLNSFLASVWPLINPDLFSSVVDMLEDVMQASLPKIIRMVSIDDMGQGNEAIRILGVRWLPTGAASQSVDKDGNLEPAEDKKSDRTTPGEGEIQNDTDGDTDQQGSKNPYQGKAAENQKQEEQEQQAIREGMEAEEGDFVNMELAFAYRARSTGKSIQSKAKNAHLYLRFYLPGGIAIPVWVELRGIIGTMRLRMQLTPDPPFVSLCTLTFMGQPRANLSCVPLSKHNLNLMNVPLISSFVQSAIDAALAEYVAPKSLTLDLKDMLVGDDFKKDTATRGVVLVCFKKARDFKQGDASFGPISGGSDCYVTLSWGKFGKAVASTRVLVDEEEPNWNEWHSILVSADELNAQEKLRVQIWDSDKHTADDDLGRVEMDLKELMHSPESQNKMWDREDSLHGEDPDEKMPGTITWSVGYFQKAHIQPCQFEQQTVDKNIRTKEELKKAVSKTAERKLREATIKDESKETDQQKSQDYKEQETAMIVSAPPPEHLVSGIFSIQIHNITGLEVQSLNKRDNAEDLDDKQEEAQGNAELPDSYCNVVINHQIVYRTRTKPKNGKPFFNAGTERFVKDWRTTEVMVSVRDSREGENDPLLGVVYLPLNKVFAKSSQVVETYPLAGGIGYGRARISMVWRSVELKMPKELTGWDYGTVELAHPVKVKSGADLHEMKDRRIRIRTNLSKVKMYHVNSDEPGGQGRWEPKNKAEDESLFLGVRRRYASCLVLEFRKSSLMLDSTPAFAVFWFHEIADEEEKTISLKVWKGGKDNLKRAENCCDYEGLEPNEQPIGEVELTLKFWRGLSGYHKKYADKQQSSDMRNVMELLDTVNDEKMAYDDWEDSEDSSDSNDDESRPKSNGIKHADTDEDIEMRKKLQKHDGEEKNSSSDEEGGNAIKDIPDKIKQGAKDLLGGSQDTEKDGSRGMRSQAQDYMQHRKQLHRKHRGPMQWKSARTLDWMVGKVKRGKGRVEGMFEHSEKDQGIETEV